MWPFSNLKSGQKQNELEQLLQQKDAELKESNAKLESLTSESNQLREELKIAQRSIINLANENRELREFKGEYKLVRDEKSVLESDLKAKQRESGAKEELYLKEIKQLNDGVAELREGLRSREEEFAQLEKGYQDKIEERDNKLRQANEELKNANAELQRNELKTAHQDIEKLEQTLKNDYAKKETALINQLEHKYGEACPQVVKQYLDAYRTVKSTYSNLDINHPMIEIMSSLKLLSKQEEFIRQLKAAVLESCEAVKEVFSVYGWELREIKKRKYGNERDKTHNS